jgi:alkyldihydroxyacetonephosphate synthase
LNEKKVNWWGWGDPKRSYDLSSRPFFWTYLKSQINLPDKPFFFAPKFDDIDIPDCRLSSRLVNQLKNLLGKSQVSISKLDRISHTYGKSYHDLIRVRHKLFRDTPDAVLFSESEEQVEKIIKWAEENKIAIVPWGGGTSVVGGVETVHEPYHNGLIVLEMNRMNSVLHVDKSSLVADVEAGILGPDLENKLQEKGLTLAHYPESFEFSTLGGWIASRSAGQQSTLYGKIEDMIESLRMVTPSGIVNTPSHPAAASGPDQKHLLCGSEGILGVITQARIRLKVIPQQKFYTAYLVSTFDDGIEICRRIIQSGLKPATVRLSDEKETDFVFSLRKKKATKLKNWSQQVSLEFVRKRGFLPGKRSFLLLGLEGDKDEIVYQRKKIDKILVDFKTFDLGEDIAKTWYRHRFENPYLRDILLDYALLVDTFETSTEWNNVKNLYSTVRKAILNTLHKLKIRGVITAHLSHLYPSGCSLYFIVIATPVVGEEIETWKELKTTASNAIINSSGSISHHHGVGLDHRAWLRQDIGDTSVELLRNLKKQIDPQNILNPKKLLPDSNLKDDTFLKKHASADESLSFSSAVREENIKKLQTEQYDILVIGGGITGAGIIRDAVCRGYRTALIEKDDFASGTSSKSSKMIHGGFRYLKNLEIGLVHDALHERKNLMELAPHLVHPMQCLLPIYEDAPNPPWMVKLGMMLYDGLSGTKSIGAHKMISVDKIHKLEPILRQKGLKKVGLYYDSWADDFRLVMSTIQSAACNHGIIANYVKAVDTLKDNGKVAGIMAQETMTKDIFPIRSRVIANATGPWSDELRNELFNDNRHHIRTTKGIHLLIHRDHLPVNHTVVLLSLQDQRPIYTIPWRKFVLIGTTDTDYHGDLDWIQTDQCDVDYLLSSINIYFPDAKLTKDKIISTFTGLRPLVCEEQKSASAVTREYQIFEKPKNFFTIIGGKLTTYRSMAEEMVNQMEKVLKKSFDISAKNEECTTDKYHLYGGDISDYRSFFKEWTEYLINEHNFDPDIAEHFVESFGSRIPDLLTAIDDTEDGRKRILPELPHVWGELTYAYRHEMVMGLDDFLIRRTHLFPLDTKQSWDIHESVANRLGILLGWTPSEKKSQIERLKSKIDFIKHYQVKGS